MRFAGRVSAANYIAAGNNAANQSSDMIETARRNAPDYEAQVTEAIRQDAANYDNAVTNAAKIINAGTAAQGGVAVTEQDLERRKAILKGKQGVRKAGMIANAGALAGAALMKKPEKPLHLTDTTLLKQEYERLKARQESFLDKAEGIRGETYPGASEQSSSASSTPSESSTSPVSENISAQQSANSSGVMSKEEVRQLAIKTGFSPDAANIVVGIAGGESGRDPSNSTKREIPGRQNLFQRDGEDSVGLMQINWGVHKGKPFLTNLGITKREHLLDPVKNMQAAKALYDGRGGGFQDWSVYNKNIYKDFL